MTQPFWVPVIMKMRLTIYLKSLAVNLIGSSLVKQQTVLKQSMNYTMRLK